MRLVPATISETNHHLPCIKETPPFMQGKQCTNPYGIPSQTLARKLSMSSN